MVEHSSTRRSRRAKCKFGCLLPRRFALCQQARDVRYGLEISDRRAGSLDPQSTARAVRSALAAVPMASCSRTTIYPIAGRDRSRRPRRRWVGHCWFGQRSCQRARRCRDLQEESRRAKSYRRAGKRRLWRRERYSRRNCGTRAATWPARRHTDSARPSSPPPQPPWPAKPKRRDLGAEWRLAITWRCAGAGTVSRPVLDWKRSNSQPTSQGKDWIEIDGAPDCCRASGKGHDHRDAENYRQQNRLNGNLRIEDRLPDLPGEQGACRKASNATD